MEVERTQGPAEATAPGPGGGDGSGASTGTGGRPVFTARKPRKEAQQGPKSRPERGSGEKGKDRLTTALATRGEHLGATHI